MKTVAAITDIHGCFKTLMALVDKLPKDAEIVLLGDLIDRGPDSRGVVEWAMSKGVPCLMGNHEDLAMAYFAHRDYGFKPKCAEYYDRDVWLPNGGSIALKSWGTKALPEKVIEWMASMPPYIIVPGKHPETGRKLLLSHTGYGLDAKKNNWMRTLWGRYPDDGYFAYDHKLGEAKDDGYYRVFGHTRTAEPVQTKTFTNIDTGCAYEGFGNLTAFVWPSMEVIQQDNVE